MRISSSSRRGAVNGVAILALIIAIAALFFALCSDPVKPGFALKVPFSSALSGYDFDTAAGTVKSEMQIQLDGDIRAQVELMKKHSKKMKERFDSFKVDKEADFKREKKNRDFDDGMSGECKILFTSFKRDGKDQKQVITMEKDNDSGLWVRSSVSSQDVREKNPQLAKDMDEWFVKDNK